MEEVIEIPNYPGYYISQDGEIMRYDGYIKTQFLNAQGYWKVDLKGKKYFVHRLVALAFIPNPDNLPIVDHIDRNTSNCTVANLRWVDALGNAANRAEYNSNSKTKQKNIYYLKNRCGTYKFVYIKRSYKEGKQIKLYEKWFDTLEDAVTFRDCRRPV